MLGVESRPVSGCEGPSSSQSRHIPCRLAQFFGVPITIFFPEAQPRSRANAVLSATADLDDADLEEVLLYAQFRKARHRTRRKR